MWAITVIVSNARATHGWYANDSAYRPAHFICNSCFPRCLTAREERWQCTAFLPDLRKRGILVLRSCTADSHAREAPPCGATCGMQQEATQPGAAEGDGASAGVAYSCR